MPRKKLQPEQQERISASDAGLHATVIQLAQRWLRQQPDDFSSWLDLGHAFWQSGRFVEAKEAFDRALQISTEHPKDVIYGELGNMNRLKGDYDQAAHWYQQQMAADPNDATGYIFLGSLRFRQGELDAAIEILEQGINCQLGCIEELFYTLGLVRLAKEDFYPAIEALQKAAQLDPKHVGVQRALKDAKKAMHLSAEI